MVVLITTLKKENFTKLTKLNQAIKHLSGAFGEPTTIDVVFTVNVSLLGASRFYDSASIIQQSAVCLIFLYVMVHLVSL